MGYRPESASGPSYTAFCGIANRIRDDRVFGTRSEIPVEAHNQRMVRAQLPDAQLFCAAPLPFLQDRLQQVLSITAFGLTNLNDLSSFKSD